MLDSIYLEISAFKSNKLVYVLLQPSSINFYMKPTWSALKSIKLIKKGFNTRKVLPFLINYLKALNNCTEPELAYLTTVGSGGDWISVRLFPGCAPPGKEFLFIYRI